MRSSRLWLLALVAPLGCLNEYHPEYHPESSVTYVQNIAYLQTVVQASVPPARSAPAAIARRPPPVGAARGNAPGGSSPRNDEGVAPGSGIASAAPADTVAREPHGWRDLFAEERAAIRALRLAGTGSDAWERVVGRPPPGEGEVDVEAEVPIRMAKAMASRPTMVEADCLLQGRSTSYGQVTGIRRHPTDDGLAQILLKVRELGTTEPGKAVAVSTGFEGKRVLTVGHVAGPAAETANEALVRTGVCTAGRDRQSLSCSGSLVVARADSPPVGTP